MKIAPRLFGLDSWRGGGKWFLLAVAQQVSQQTGSSRSSASHTQWPGPAEYISINRFDWFIGQSCQMDIASRCLLVYFFFYFSLCDFGEGGRAKQ